MFLPIHRSMGSATGAHQAWASTGDKAMPRAAFSENGSAPNQGSPVSAARVSLLSRVKSSAGDAAGSGGVRWQNANPAMGAFKGAQIGHGSEGMVQRAQPRRAGDQAGMRFSAAKPAKVAPFPVERDGGATRAFHQNEFMGPGQGIDFAHDPEADPRRRPSRSAARCGDAARRNR